MLKEVKRCIGAGRFISRFVSCSGGANDIAKAFTLGGRSRVIEDIESVLPHLGGTDMEGLSRRVIGKLRNMSDEEFGQLELIKAR